MNRVFFPPPEILSAVSQSVGLYLKKKGSLSLDESLLGQVHKKNSSIAFLSSTSGKFFLFHKLWVELGSLDKELNGLSMEQKVENYLNSPFCTPSQKEQTDIDTFLRNYRRWRKKAPDLFRSLKPSR